jgi:endogenous inhibitor of DNA gyrase (YacG/DUF329 family)
LFTINLPAKKALTVRCTACKLQVSVKENKTPAPFTMAFNHPKQEIKQACPSCGAEMVWLPEEAVIADAIMTA